MARISAIVFGLILSCGSAWAQCGPTQPITNGGTAACTAAGARTNLGVAAAGASTTVNSQTCTLGSTCTIPFQTNSSSNTSQAGVNFETSSTNAEGLKVTPTNTGTNVMTFEITSAYTGTLTSSQVTTALTYTPANCTAGTANGNCLTNGMTTLGDMIYGGASGAGTRLAGPTGAASTTYVFTNTTTGGSAAQAPAWLNAPALSAANMTGFPTVGTATNLAGGALGSLPYQSGAGATAFIASPTTSGHVFVPAWAPSGSAIAPGAVDANTLNVNSASTATSATSATTATNVAGGGAGSIPYQTAAGTTGFIAGNATGSTDAVLTSTAVSSAYSSTSLKNAPALSAANMTAFPAATSSVLGAVKPDGTSILNTAGAISATAASVGADASGAAAARAGTGNCSANQYETGDATGGPTCAQVAYSQLSGTPAASVLPAITTTVSSGSISAVTTNNTYVICTSTCTVTPLAPAAGVQLCVRNAPGSATVITLAALGAGNYYELTTHAAWGTANHSVVSAGVATDQICLVGYDANHYAVFSYTGTWTD